MKGYFAHFIFLLQLYFFKQYLSLAVNTHENDGDFQKSSAVLELVYLHKVLACNR